MTEPFNPACFSFDKAKQNEILFILGYDEEKKHFNVYNNVWLSVSIKGRPRMRNVMKNLHFIVISMVWRVGIQRTWIVSPVAKNQHLYVPNPTKHYAQVFFFFFLWFHRFTILIFCIIFCPFSISFRVPIMHYSSIRMLSSSFLPPFVIRLNGWASVNHQHVYLPHRWITPSGMDYLFMILFQRIPNYPFNINQLQYWNRYIKSAF